MNKMKIISKIATFSAAAAFVFAALSGTSTYFILQITYSSAAPIDYVALNALSTMLPYLTTGVIALIVAVMTKSSSNSSETPETEEATPVQDEEPEVSA